MLTNTVSSLLIVLSLSTYRDAEWKAVADTLKSKHADIPVEILTSAPSVTNSLYGIRDHRARSIAFVMRPDEVNAAAIMELKRVVAKIDDDPFDDAIWGIVTGPTAAAAKRIAASSGPNEFKGALSTTGLPMDIVPGAVTMLSDANPPGGWKLKDASGKEVEGRRETGDTSDLFAQGWNLDPELVLTSSHATERNLEMPFSRGNLLPKDGKFVVTAGTPLSEPKREKVWIAAGNCLIANNRYPQSMVMTALGWGKVNQFVGYIKETWFGEIGWGVWDYFATYRMPLNECWYFANANLVRTLPATKPQTKERMGKLWDWDGTAFYGDPLQKLALPAKAPPAWHEGARPLGILFNDSIEGRRLLKAPEGFEVFVADDFALVTKWPADLPVDWQNQLEFSK